MPRLSTACSTDWLTTHDPLAVVPWPDAVVENLGHAPRSVYVETYWLPVLGPSATWAIRRLAAWLDAEPGGYELCLTELGRELGLGPGTGRSSAVIRTLSRLVAFGKATPVGNALAVRRMLAPLTQRQVRWLPAALAARHDAEVRGAVHPLPQQPQHQPTSRALCHTTPLVSVALCDTTSLVRIAPAVGEARPGEAGNGTAARSGKPTVVPPPAVRNTSRGGTR